MLERMWINQPSTLQPLHNLHGVHVLAYIESEQVTRVYFLSGDVVSQQVPNMALSLGWPNQFEMLQALETAEESFENFAGAGKDDGTLGVIRRAIARVKGRGDKRPNPIPKMLAVLEAAIDDWPEWDDPDEPVNGGDMVEWFGGWRQDAQWAIAAAKEKVE